MKKILLGLLLGFIVATLAIVYSLEVVNLETTESGELVTIKIFDFYESYYIEK